VRTAIVGAGPTGLYLAIALARRHHQVMVVDRDPGPSADGAWPRRGVMQFHHPHAFRGQVVQALLAEMPEVLDALVTAGAVPQTIPEQPGRIAMLQCRRATFERVLRSAALAEPGVELRQGHADDVRAERGHAVGLLVDGQQVDADLVLDASGRVGRLSQGRRAAPNGGDCGIAYTSRQHRLLPDAEAGPVNSAIGMLVAYPDYQVVVFPHDNRTFSTLVARLASDHDLAELRHQPAFDAACRAIPALAAWTDPDRSEPITAVLPGGRLTNSYRGQRNENGRVALEGLIFIGDAVCTTNPTAGRGVATSLMQAGQLLQLLDQYGTDYLSCSLALEEWCEINIEPWFADHVAMDADQVRRWSGLDIDLSTPLPSDVIHWATAVDPSMMRVVGPYLGMEALPDSLKAVEARAREIYASGWRPAIPEGPTRNQLAQIVNEAVPHP
jgi:2-polyprenyl-6-methoxyphenol hydroxylase-like FAD-dependent oxidoreductase